MKDRRTVDLKQGINDIAFEGVATQIKPETALLDAPGIKVLEQNYDYDLLTANNIIDKSVGQTVKTVVSNPTTGQNIYDSAEIVSAVYGQPLLKFNYGIETHFPGRLVFEKLPDSLRSETDAGGKNRQQQRGIQKYIAGIFDQRYQLENKLCCQSGFQQ